MNCMINERYRRSDLVLTQSREDFMMDLKIKNEISRTNSFSYSNISSLNSNTSPVDQQFTKLMAFVQQEKRPVVHQELEKLLPPLLCHLYIEMLKGKDWKPAHDFLRKYSVLLGPIDAKTQQKFNGNDTVIPSPIVFSSKVLNNQNSHLKPPPTPSPASEENEKQVRLFKELIENLSTLQRIEDCESNRDIVMFRSCKYEVKLSNQALASLNKFLAKHGHVLILQLLHVWFSMDLYQLKDDMNEIDDDQLSTSSSSSSDSIINFSEYSSSNYNVVKQKSTNRDRSTAVTKFDQLNCDNQKDISNSRLHSFSSNNNEQQQNYEELHGSANNLKLKRLQSCLNQVNSKYHMPIRIFNINNTDNSLCSVNLDKSMCHLAAGFEDSTIMLWSLNGYENYGRKPYQMFDDRLCKWSINNCNRYLTDDLSDYSSDDEELVKDLRAAQEVEHDDDDLDEADSDKCSTSQQSTTHKLGKYNDNSTTTTTKTSKRMKFSNKYKRSLTIRQQWNNYKFNSCSDNSFSNSQSIVLRGHRSAVTDLMFGRKHDIMLSVSRDSTLRVWKSDSYTCASVYRGHEYPIWCVDESSNGCYAATGSRDSTARLWSYERKFPVKTFVGHTQDVECIAFHPNGVYIATGSTDTTIRMWCVVSGKVLRIFTDCHLPVNAISFSPDGKFLAAAGDETKIRIFDLAAGQQLADLKNHTAPVKSLSWSSNSKKLLSGCTDGNFYVWNINYLGLSSSSSSTKDSKSSAIPSTSRYPASNSESSSSKSTTANPSSNSATNNSSTLLQMSHTGSKRILKVRFDGDNDLIHMIGND